MIEEIYNYHKVPNLYETSGQPTRNQFKLLIEEDYEIVINLAQESVVGKVAFNEKNILESSKIEYIHIPVDFDNPKESDFEKKYINLLKAGGSKSYNELLKPLNFDITKEKFSP